MRRGVFYIEAGKNDMLFRPETAEAEYERLIPYFRAAGAEDNLRFKIFDGDHMLDRGDEGIEFFFEIL